MTVHAGQPASVPASQPHLPSVDVLVARHRRTTDSPHT